MEVLYQDLIFEFTFTAQKRKVFKQKFTQHHLIGKHILLLEMLRPIC